MWAQIKGKKRSLSSFIFLFLLFWSASDTFFISNGPIFRREKEKEREIRFLEDRIAWSYRPLKASRRYQKEEILVFQETAEPSGRRELAQRECLLKKNKISFLMRSDVGFFLGIITSFWKRELTCWWQNSSSRCHQRSLKKKIINLGSQHPSFSFFLFNNF